MSRDQVRAGQKQGFGKKFLGVIKWASLSFGVASIFLSLALIVGAAPGSWAQCGSDSSVECSGGVRCTSTDQVGCACYDSNGGTVMKRSCKYAAPDDDTDFMIETFVY